MANRHPEKYLFKEDRLSSHPLKDSPLFLFHRHKAHHGSGIDNALQIAEGLLCTHSGMGVLLTYRATVITGFQYAQ
jgi:hypothetical protein